MRRFLPYAACAAGVAALVLLLDLLGPGRVLELKSRDLRHALAPLPQAPPESVLFVVDRKSLAEYPDLPFPWPRSMYAPVVRFAKAAGARAVVFDLLFTETGGYGREDDAELGAALRDFGRAFGAVDLSRDEPLGRREDPGPALAAAALEARGTPPARLPAFSNATLPIEEIRSGFAGLGAANALEDLDHIHRRAPLFFRWAPRGGGPPLLIPSLPMRVFLAEGGKGAGPPSFAERAVRAGPGEFPVDGEGAAIVRFLGPPGRIPTYPIQEAIGSFARMEEGREPLVPLSALKDRRVWIGVDLPGKGADLVAAPPSGVFRGVEYQATVLENLLRGTFLREPPRGTTALSALAAAALAAVFAARVPSAFLAAFLTVLLLAAHGGAALLAFGRGLVLPVASPFAAGVLAFAAAAAARFAAEGRERRWIRRTFQRYLSRELVDRLAANPEALRLGGEEREVTIFFSDLAGFTSATEKIPPERLTRLLILYATFLTERIVRSGGFVDKFIGDAVMAFWGGLVEQDHARLAARAAADIQAELPLLKDLLAAEGLPFLPVRIGLHTGRAVVGNTGAARTESSDEHFNFTVIGDSVNLASRLEGANKEIGTVVLMSEETFAGAGEAVRAREVGAIRVKGRERPARVYELLGREDGGRRTREGQGSRTDTDGSGREGAAPPGDGFAEALAKFRAASFAQARGMFEALAAEGDGVAARYSAACAKFLDHPPPPDWDGILNLDTK